MLLQDPGIQSRPLASPSLLLRLCTSGSCGGILGAGLSSGLTPAPRLAAASLCAPFNPLLAWARGRRAFMLLLPEDTQERARETGLNASAPLTQV